MGMSFTVTVFFSTYAVTKIYVLCKTNWLGRRSYSVHSVNIPSSPCIVFLSFSQVTSPVYKERIVTLTNFVLVKLELDRVVNPTESEVYREGGRAEKRDERKKCWKLSNFLLPYNTPSFFVVVWILQAGSEERHLHSWRERHMAKGNFFVVVPHKHCKLYISAFFPLLSSHSPPSRPAHLPSLPSSLSHRSGSVRSPRAQLNWPTPFHICSVWLSQFHCELVQCQPPPLHQWNHEDTDSTELSSLHSPEFQLAQ